MQQKIILTALITFVALGVSSNTQAALFSAGQLQKECAVAVKIEKNELAKNHQTMAPALNCMRFIEGVRQTRLAFAIQANKNNLSYAQTHYGKVNNGERVLSVYNYLKAHESAATKPAALAVLAALNQNYPLKTK